MLVPIASAPHTLQKERKTARIKKKSYCSSRRFIIYIFETSATAVPFLDDMKQTLKPTVDHTVTW